jgi:hypothetical protein
MSMEHWWDETDQGGRGTEILREKPVLLCFSLKQIIHKSSKL